MFLPFYFFVFFITVTFYVTVKYELSKRQISCENDNVVLHMFNLLLWSHLFSVYLLKMNKNDNDLRPYPIPHI